MNFSNTVFLTFGDSWMLGHGAQYNPGMSEEEYKQSIKIQDDLDKLSFRGQISTQFGMSNINFSSAGSSNQRQFRLAKEFFVSEDYKQLRSEGKKFVVLWGITATPRNEFFLADHQLYVNFMYNELETRDHPLPKSYVTYSYDHLNEVRLLMYEIEFWNSWFNMSKIKNLWFDTFDHHPYGSQVFNQSHKESYINVSGPDWPSWENFLARNFNNVSLEILEEIANLADIFKTHISTNKQMSNFILDHPNTRDLYSNLLRFNNCPVLDIPWKENTELVKLGILNPYTKHPTKLGQKQLAELINPYINQALSH